MDTDDEEMDVLGICKIIEAGPPYDTASVEIYIGMLMEHIILQRLALGFQN